MWVGINQPSTTPTRWESFIGGTVFGNVASVTGSGCGRNIPDYFR
jgi:hypothetical protein